MVLADPQIQNDVEIMLEAWSASFSDNGWIWEKANKRLKNESKNWSDDYRNQVFKLARDQWYKPKDN